MTSISNENVQMDERIRHHDTRMKYELASYEHALEVGSVSTPDGPLSRAANHAAILAALIAQATSRGDNG